MIVAREIPTVGQSAANGRVERGAWGQHSGRCDPGPAGMHNAHRLSLKGESVRRGVRLTQSNTRVEQGDVSALGSGCSTLAGWLFNFARNTQCWPSARRPRSARSGCSRPSPLRLSTRLTARSLRTGCCCRPPSGARRSPGVAVAHQSGRRLYLVMVSVAQRWSPRSAREARHHPVHHDVDATPRSGSSPRPAR